jgi:hypothetical protein
MPDKRATQHSISKALDYVKTGIKNRAKLRGFLTRLGLAEDQFLITKKYTICLNIARDNKIVYVDCGRYYYYQLEPQTIITNLRNRGFLDGITEPEKVLEENSEDDDLSEI